MRQRAQAAAQRYLNRRAFGPPRVRTAPSPRLGLVVVVPSRDEPELLRTLECLRACRRPACDVEVLVVVNASERDEPIVHERNRKGLRAARRWAAKVPDDRLQFRFLDYPRLPARTAGVGLARKLGMDEAVARLDAAGAPDGVVACLDADCLCDLDYLEAIDRHFRDSPATPGCSIHFEHPLAGPLDSRLYDGIAHYELYLRYHVHGLRRAALPFAFHTIGSCMAVRASAYVSQGGMNCRQAGEDFYFLQKLVPLDGFSELRTTTVTPSPRASRRLPFGTGRAMQRWLDGEDRLMCTPSPRVFEDLAVLSASVERFHTLQPEDPRLLTTLPDIVSAFLERSRFRPELARLQQHTASLATFRRQLFRWFNAFRTIKFINFASDTAYPREPVALAAAKLLQHDARGECRVRLGDATARQLLAHYRDIDRGKRSARAALPGA